MEHNCGLPFYPYLLSTVHHDLTAVYQLLCECMLPKFSSSLSNMACIEFKPPLLDISKHQFVKPTKLIKVEEQMPQFQESKAHQLIIAFLSVRMCPLAVFVVVFVQCD